MNSADRVDMSVKVKTSSDGVTRRFRLMEVTDEDLFGTLMSQLHVLYGNERKGQVTYVDCDGDVIVVSSTAELMEAIRLTPSLLTIHWKEEAGKLNGNEQVILNQDQEERPTFSAPPGCGRGRGRGFGRGRRCHGRGRRRFENERPFLERTEWIGRRFEKKKEKIEEKMAILKGKDDDAEGKWKLKLEKLERKLNSLDLKKEYIMKKKQERAYFGEFKKSMRKTHCLQKRLSNIREAKMRIERKQEEIRMRLGRLETDDGLGTREKRMEHLREHVEKLEQRYSFLLSREREVEEMLERCSESEEDNDAQETCAERRKKQFDLNESCQVVDDGAFDCVYLAKQ